MMLVRFGPAIKTGGFKIRAWFLFLWLSTDCINLQEVRQPYEEILLSCLTFNFQSFRPGVQCTIAAEQTNWHTGSQSQISISSNFEGFEFSFLEWHAAFHDSLS